MKDLEQWFDVVTLYVGLQDPDAFESVDLVAARRQIGDAATLVSQVESSRPRVVTQNDSS